MLHTKFEEYRPTGSGDDFLAFESMAAMLSMQPQFHDKISFSLCTKASNKISHS